MWSSSVFFMFFPYTKYNATSFWVIRIKTIFLVTCKSWFEKYSSQMTNHIMPNQLDKLIHPL